MRSLRKIDSNQIENKTDSTTCLVRQTLLPEIVTYDNFPDNSHHFMQMNDLLFIAPKRGYYEDRYPRSVIFDIERPEDYYELKVRRHQPNSNVDFSHAITLYKNYSVAILPSNSHGIEIHNFREKKCEKAIGEFKDGINLAYSISLDRFIVIFANHFEIWNAQTNQKLAQDNLPMTCNWCAIEICNNEYAVIMLGKERDWTLFVVNLHNYKLSNINEFKDTIKPEIIVLPTQRVITLSKTHHYTELHLLSIHEREETLRLREDDVKIVHWSSFRLSLSSAKDLMFVMTPNGIDFYRVNEALNLQEPCYSFLETRRNNTCGFYFNWLPDNTLLVHKGTQPMVLLDPLNRTENQVTLSEYDLYAHTKSLFDGRLLMITKDYNLFLYEFNHLINLKKQIENHLFKSIDEPGTFPTVLSKLISEYALDLPALYPLRKHKNSSAPDKKEDVSDKQHLLVNCAVNSSDDFESQTPLQAYSLLASSPTNAHRRHENLKPDSNQECCCVIL